VVSAEARLARRLVKFRPRKEPMPSLRRSRRGVPSQFRVGSGMGRLIVSAWGLLVEDKVCECSYWQTALF